MVRRLFKNMVSITIKDVTCSRNKNTKKNFFQPKVNGNITIFINVKNNQFITILLPKISLKLERVT